jgi:hypothetical protein
MYDDERSNFDDGPVIDGDHEPVTRAVRKFDGTCEDAIRPFADISAKEWARYQRAKGITDPAKLAALVPACNRPWTFPKSHGPDSVFTFAELRFVPDAPAKVKNLLSRRCAEVLRIPGGLSAEHGGAMMTAEYVRAFESANYLVQS